MSKHSPLHRLIRSPRYFFRSRSAAIMAAVAILGLTAGVAIPAAAGPAPGTTAKLSAVYQAKIVNQHIVLGPQSDPSHLTETAALPAGNYVVTAIASAVIASQDEIVCAVGINGSNDGVFGTAGNPGTGNIYGTATMTDTIHVTADQQLELTCNSFNYGLGTWVGNAVVEAVPVASVK